MAKRKPSSRSPQPQHRENVTRSQFDKRERLRQANPERRHTTQSIVSLCGVIGEITKQMMVALDPRLAFRLPILISGILLGTGRRTASSWFRAAGVLCDWDRFYHLLKVCGELHRSLARIMLRCCFRLLSSLREQEIRLAIDDSPTERYGKKVEGAGVHRDPTSGPVGSNWLFGLNWVTLAFLHTRGNLGVIALPLLSALYVRRQDVPKLAKYQWKFATKLELAQELITWLLEEFDYLEIAPKLILAADAAYASAEFCEFLAENGITLVSRLKKNAALTTLPPASTTKRRGRPLVYGKDRIDLEREASIEAGWTELTYRNRGVQVTRFVKVLQAVSKVTRSEIRVVMLRYENGTVAYYFSTDPTMPVEKILEIVSDRWAIEELFHDLKEVCRAGEQQIRNLWANIGCWHLNLWAYVMIEVATEKSLAVADRSMRPWDNPNRRPSHADRRRSVVQEMLEKQFISPLPSEPIFAKIRDAFSVLFAMCA